MPDVEEKPKMEDLARSYIELRTAIKQKELEQVEELAPLKEEFAAIGDTLLAICNEQNMDSVRTSGGTVSRRVSTRYWTSDWGAMHEFILKHEAPFLLEQRVHNGHMREFLEENENCLPIGLQADSKYVVQVRKPNAK